MKLKIYPLFLLLFFWHSSLQSQDIHYSQFDWIPLLLNPAMSGNLPDADFQYGAIYREQGFTVSPDAYSSFSLFADAKLRKGLRSQDHIGLSAMVFHDDAGTGALTTNEIRVNLAYHLKLSEKNVLSLGAQGGVLQRSYGNYAGFSFEEQLEGNVFSETLQNDTRQYFDGNAGLVFNSALDELSNLQIGASAFHLNNKTTITDISSIDKFRLRYSAFAKYNRQLNDRLDLEPKAQFNYLEGSKEVLAQVVLGVLLSEYYNTPFKLNFGGGWRMNDSWQLLLGAEYGKWELGFAFDSNISGLAKASGLVAGVELGIKYRHSRKEKKEDPKPIIQEIEPIQIDLLLLVEDELDSVRISISEGPVIVEDSINSIYPFQKELTEDRKYTILVEKPGYTSANVSFTTSGITQDSTIEKIVALNLIPIDPAVPSPPSVVEEIPPVVEEVPPAIVESTPPTPPIEEEETPPVFEEKVPPVEEVIIPPKEEIVIINKPKERPPITETEEIIIYREDPFVLKNILYAFDDDEILKRAEKDLNYILQLMSKYPDMVIELSSHTDVRGSDRYNERLSQWRADSAKSWLVDRGIASNRIIAKGYGEYQLANKCYNGVECTEEEHQENRRTEFKILEGPTSVRYRVR